MAEQITQESSRSSQVALLHGRMKGDEKEA